ncbi:arrestin domain-containing protein 1-like isoform X1 [Haliotis asinina]|uniref:arrestin domain-containing protein 1-like isoform X1 n=1 Tax=Haliotis asinina TaxID=109174 RepID=UPI0035319873
MPIFQTCAVILDGKKEVYRKGETVTGSLVLDVTEDVTVKGVRVYLYGETLVKWDEFSPGSLGGTKDYIAKEKYFGLVYTVFGKKQNATGPNHTLTAGRHNYRYKFNLPKEGLPSSFEGEYGAIRFWVKVEVDRPFPNFNQCWYRGITILDDINVNDPQYKSSVRRQAKKQVSKALGLGDAGTLTLTAATDRGAYCAGEKVALKVVANNESTKDMGKLKAQLEQKVVYTANNETKTRQIVIRVLEGTPVTKGEERAWNNQLLEVDAIPPSTKTRSCHIIAVSYYIKVLVEVPLGFNLETTLPITIGTIPYGHTPATAGATAGPSTEIDASSAITYTKCNRGFQVCRKSEGNFVNYNYIPMCAYVVNYTFPPPTRPTAAAAPSRPAAASSRPSPAAAPAGPRPAAAAPSRPSPTATPSRPSPAAATNTQPKPVSQSEKVPPATFVQAPSLGPYQAPSQVTSYVPPQAPLQATAPPMELPPSYEDVLRMDNPAATTETAVTPEMADKPYGVLFLRFPDTRVEEFRDTIGREHQSLAECEGEIIAFAPQTLHEPNEWPARTSVAILKFPSEEVAADWFNKTDPRWLGTCDAIVLTMKEQFREANHVFSMTSIKYKLPLQKAKVNRYTKLALKTVRPLRLLQKGVVLVSSSKFTPLRGSWVEDKTHVTVSQWETMDLYFEFRNKNKTAPYKECYDLLREMADVRPSVIFQSEDLSLFQMTSIQTAERSDSPSVEFQSQNTQAEAESNASGEVNEASQNVNETSGERRAESTRSESPAVEVQSEDIDNTESQTQSESSSHGEDADGEDEEETVDTKAPVADLQ